MKGGCASFHTKHGSFYKSVLMGTLYSYYCVLIKWFTTGFTSVDPFSNCSELIFVGVHYTA